MCRCSFGLPYHTEGRCFWYFYWENILRFFLHPPLAPVGGVEPAVSSLSWRTPLTCLCSCIGKSASCACLVACCGIDCLHALAICVCELLKIAAHWYVKLSHCVGCLKCSLARRKCMQTSVRDLFVKLANVPWTFVAFVITRKSTFPSCTKLAIFGFMWISQFPLEGFGAHFVFAHAICSCIANSTGAHRHGQGGHLSPPLEMFKSVFCCICWLKPQ